MKDKNLGHTKLGIPRGGKMWLNVHTEIGSDK